MSQSPDLPTPSLDLDAIREFGPFRAYATDIRVDSGVVPDKVVKTHCCFCGQQCGVQLKVKDNTIIGIEPWYEFPFNRGMLCPKGVTRYLQQAHPDRLLHAYQKDPGSASGFRKMPYEEAIKRVAEAIERIQSEHGPDAFAVLTGPVSMQYEFDWLGNQTLWNDDQSAFYERSLTTSSATDGIVNGYDVGGRPGSMVFASNVLHSGGVDPLVDRGGFVELEYGVGGNVVSTTVRGQCRDTALACSDPGGTSVSSRASSLRSACDCDVEQHYQYRYDELNRLSEARRYDRGTGRSTWELEVRQQYRYDAGNVRMVKRTLDGFTHGAGQYGTDGVERAALYVYPGDFERRGLTTNSVAGTYDASVGLGTETQYMVAGTRLVWKDGAFGGIGGTLEPDARLTMALPDLLQSTTVVLDLFSGALLERGTYLPNGARETLRTEHAGGAYGLELMGFTGKEGDDEVGLVYFGHRYLMPHLGRWAARPRGVGRERPGARASPRR